MKVVKKDASTLQQEVEWLQRELLGTQEMLAQVLQVTGPVEINKDVVKGGLPENAQILLDDDQDANVFRFSLVTSDE